MSEKTFLQVLSGNPEPTQVAALTVLFAGLAASAQAEEASRERNQWGNLDERLQRHTTFNPSAFQNVNFF
ncbi:acyl-CoA carboxylase subunit epsilon [Corynebacterium pacaense]|uniref:acyl-CoA carboxylase subunit epsilon n=1 Tax=Corynebacterium pacaense TaxID=1816684 RepID=UPI0009BAAA4A|nr:acyl-CoA carboxylase subunit epsilon [Corynebacterium pacaense]